jgi:hypothetical protein
MHGANMKIIKLCVCLYVHICVHPHEVLLEQSDQEIWDGNKKNLENFECHTLFERLRRLLNVIIAVLEAVGC